MNSLFKKNFALFAGGFLVFWGLASMATCSIFNSSITMVAFISWLLLGLLLLELLTQATLRIGIGSHYKHWLYGFMLVDHPQYGFRFRRSVDAAKVEFPLFDRVLFSAGTRPSDDTTTNQQQRLRFTTNSLGFRGAEFSIQKNPDVTRIFCVGGSTTASTFCHDSETWPSQLQHLLDNAGYAVEVINAGTLGWYSYQSRQLICSEISQYHPDIILLHEGWNEEFMYSSLQLGKDWQPGMIRNAREAYNLYSAPSPLMSSTASISFSLLAQHYCKRYRFAPNMSFDNPARWQMLKEPAYLQAWFDNMLAIADCCSTAGSLLYTLNYPGLTGIADLPQHRKAYIENTRLTASYADYQAISKFRIDQTFEHTRRFIPCLDIDQAFQGIDGIERVALFEDELHMSAAGNAKLALNLFNQLLQQPKVVQRLAGESVAQMIEWSPDQATEARSLIGKNPGFINRLIDKHQFPPLPYRPRGLFSNLLHGRRSTSFDIPQTRYTTW